MRSLADGSLGALNFVFQTGGFDTGDDASFVFIRGGAAGAGRADDGFAIHDQHAAGQLEMELKANSWFAIGADKSLVFGNEPEKKWRRAMDKRQIPL